MAEKEHMQGGELYEVGIKRKLMELCRKLPCSLLGLVSREIQQWVVFSGARDLTNSEWVDITETLPMLASIRPKLVSSV